MKRLTPMLTALMIGIALPAAMSPATAMSADTSVIAEPTGAPVLLRSSVVLETDRVHLSDLFDGVPADVDAIVSGSPEPGRARLFTYGLLKKVAEEHGLDWQDGHPRSRVRVERAGEYVNKTRVIDQLSMALMDSGVSGPFEIHLYNRFVSVMLPRGVAYDIWVESLDHETRDGRLQATLRIDTADGSTHTARIMGRVYALVQIPVLTRSILPGNLITENDVAWQQMRAQRVNPTIVSGVTDLIGKEARRPITAGKMIRTTDVAPRMLVKRRDRVTLVVTTNLMRLTAKGLALHDGALGDIIQIRNTVSNRVVEGKVTASGIVEVITQKHMDQKLDQQLAQISQ